MAKDQQKTQKGQGTPNYTEDQAREYFEKRRWPNGPCCIECGSVNVYRLQGKSTRPGLIKCRDCKAQFTVTVDSVMADSHLPLSKWAMAFHMMTSSKKGISALQLQRNLGLGSYKTAWHLAHRVREAMRCEPLAGLLKGDVQADETYIGPDRRGKRREPGRKPRKHGRGTDKSPIFVLVDKDKAHARPVERVNGDTLGAIMREAVDSGARIITDELRVYPKATKGFADHQTVNHGSGEYVRPDGLNTNSAESFFALLKRGVHGTFHHISRKHAHRNCDEFSFRWSGRKLSDTERRDLAVQGAEGKRLMYKSPAEKAS